MGWPMLPSPTNPITGRITAPYQPVSNGFSISSLDAHGGAVREFRQVAVNDRLGAVERLPGSFRRPGWPDEPPRHLHPRAVANAGLHGRPHGLAVARQVATGLVA